jgi:hypothetical protein
MTYCFHCGHFTPGNPLFCNRCGRSYDVRLCPRLHPNSRHAEVCSQCGSSELSTPQPKVPVWRKALAFLLQAFLGIFLALLSLLIVLAVLTELLRQAMVQEELLAIGLLLLPCWLVWRRLPDWLREWIRRSIRKERRNEH